MITTANASAPKNLGISQCQQDRSDMREAGKRCLCDQTQSLIDWYTHSHRCEYYLEGKRIADRKAKVWDWFNARRTIE